MWHRDCGDKPGWCQLQLCHQAAKLQRWLCSTSGRSEQISIQRSVTQRTAQVWERLVETGCGKQKRRLFLCRETVTGNAQTAAQNQALHHLPVPASSIPPTLLRNTKSSGPVSPDDVINDDRFWGHKQGVKSLWDFRELHPLRFKYL